MLLQNMNLISLVLIFFILVEIKRIVWIMLP